MGICLNVYRRGAVYWWRCRFGPAEGGAKVRDVALSLRTCDPRSARSLGVRLNAEAEEARRALRDGGGGSLDAVRVALMQAAEDLMRAHRIVAEQGHVFEMSSTVLDGFFEAKAAREAARPTGAVTIEIERRILGRIGRDAAERLDRKIAALRSALTFDWQAGQVDEFARAMDEQRALGVICRLLALKGSSARIDAKQQIELRAAGFDPGMIEHMTTLLREHARSEQYRTWTVGPTYEQVVGLLTEAGVDPSDIAAARIRRNGLLLLARLLDDADRRYEQPSLIVSAAYEDILAAAAADATGFDVDCHGRMPQSTERTTDKRTSTEARPASSDEGHPVPDGSIKASGSRIISFFELVDDLIATKTSGKKSDWDPKTIHQHRAIAKLFAKIAGTDDLSLLNQTHVGKYFSTLARLPKSYGKSSKDEFRSLDELLMRAKDLDDDEVGLEPGTVNRHQIQLGTILKHFKANGFDCGTASDSFRRPENRDEEERNPFTEQDGTALFSSPIYTGYESLGARLSPGEIVVHDALYFVPLLDWYELFRLSGSAGLLVDEVDLVCPAIQIQNNSERRIKNFQSKRRIALHPEILRLGFLDYVREIKALGYELVFPELKLRGAKTPLSALFYKKFKPMLELALPLAQEKCQTLHSMRKTGNTAMLRPDVPDPVRLRIMGHTLPGVNGKHYTAPLPDEIVLEALRHIPNVTRHVKAFPINLSPQLKRN